MGTQNLRPRCVLAFVHGHTVTLREVHDGNLDLQCMCRFPRHVHSRKKVMKKYLDTMHHLYVFDSEREGGAEKRQVFVSKLISIFTNDPLAKSCYS